MKGFHDGEQDAFGSAFVRYAAFDGFANEVLIGVEDGEGTAAVIQKPVAVIALLNGGIHQAIGAKVIALVALVHRHEDLGVQELDREKEKQKKAMKWCTEHALRTERHLNLG